MSAKIIDGLKLAEKINDKTVRGVLDLCGSGSSLRPDCYGRRPSLAIISAGDNPESALYVKRQENKAKSVGIDTNHYKCEAGIGQKKILETIDFLNKDDEIDGIMVQLPLPKDMGYDTDGIIAAISPEKDVDRFHPKNIEQYVSAYNPDHILPPVFGAVIEILDSIDCDLPGKKAVIISKSEVFGGNLTKVLERRGARAEMRGPDDPQLGRTASEADILISAVGRAKFIGKALVKKDAVVIDIGISRAGDGIAGDVDFEDVKDRCGFITPVPGGVGPLAVAMALRNTLELYKRKSSHNS